MSFRDALNYYQVLADLRAKDLQAKQDKMLMDETNKILSDGSSPAGELTKQAVGEAIAGPPNPPSLSNDAQDIARAEQRYRAWRLKQKPLGDIYAYTPSESLQLAVHHVDTYILADTYLVLQDQAAIKQALKNRPVTIDDLVSLGFAPDMPESGSVAYGWPIRDKYEPDNEDTRIQLLAEFDNNGCVIWLETYSADGKTIALVELPRKSWTLLQVEELLSHFKE